MFGNIYDLKILPQHYAMSLDGGRSLARQHRHALISSILSIDYSELIAVIARVSFEGVSFNGVLSTKENNTIY